MPTSWSVFSTAGRAILAVAFLVLYGEALLVALPLVVLSLPLFDPFMAWIGPALLVSLLGITLWSGWRALQSGTDRRAGVAAPAARFVSIWAFYNATGAAIVIAL